MAMRVSSADAVIPICTSLAIKLSLTLRLAGLIQTSPLLAPIKSYPPTLVSVGTGEVLADDSLLFHAKLLAAGADCRLSAIAGMEHVAVVRSLTMPGAPETFEAVAAFIEEALRNK